MSVKRKSYKFRLYPNDVQRSMFSKTFGCARFIWNTMLSAKNDHYKTHHKMLYNTPAQYKTEFPWLKEVDSLALANVQLNLEKAYKSAFKSGFGFPKFKKKTHDQSYSTNNQKDNIRIENGKIKLPKIGWVRVKQHRTINGKIKTVTISKTNTDKYYISILCEETVKSFQKTGSMVGIDLGIESFASLSDSSKIDNPRFLNNMLSKLAKEQRSLSRCIERAKKEKRKLSDSKNYQKKRLRVAKLHEKISNQRNDFLHKVSTGLVKNHDVICVETLDVKQALQNKHLARHISDASWSEFIRMLEYKCEWYDKKLVKINKWFPSSQICSNCGENDGKKSLNIRSWTCSNCDVKHDRDINAAINILNEGLRLA